ncbi:DUF2949 domain-containing protein [Acaryochloris sp. CCMEE 5410]|uniref:DUF2949 domain-containing protein n=1 Tax=Acaryochloris sp. CCMEE 5410 TaxID=310037 RepID=UPI0002484AB5|nr:DUF2949 domain-containing protein [Acaryochloris sp. CCMEE 5410]
MKSLKIDQFIAYLQNELDIPPESVQLALKKVGAFPCRLSIALWQYGLVSLNQLNEMFAWLETHHVSCNDFLG